MKKLLLILLILVSCSTVNPYQKNKDLIKNEKVGSYFRSDLYLDAEPYNWFSSIYFIRTETLNEGYCIKVNKDNIILEIYGCVKYTGD